jgi:hypothetical protein
MSHLVFLPVYPELPNEAQDQLVRAVEEITADGCELEERT